MFLHRVHLPRGDLRVGHRRLHELLGGNVFECDRGHVGDELHELRERNLLRGRRVDVLRHLSLGNLRERIHAELRPVRRRDVFGGRDRDHVHELPGRPVLARRGQLHDGRRRGVRDQDVRDASDEPR